MTEALDKLIEAVKAGTLGSSQVLACALPFVKTMEAYNGSLDAAAALHEALLPGFWYELKSQHAKVGDDYSSNNDAEGFAPTTARAWLLAILRAYGKQQAAT